MNEFGRGRLATKYITLELLPSLFVGLAIFLLILIMFQSLKLSEYVIVHGADFTSVTKLVSYLVLGFLPILFPIALLFSILLTYGRMSQDSEIVAFQALGLSWKHLLVPALIVGGFSFAGSMQVSFKVAPWGKRQMDVLTNQLAQMKPGVTIREGVFSEGFFDLVVYAHDIDSHGGELQKVFIYDARDKNSPMTIIAKRGLLDNTQDLTGLRASLKLIDGSVHKSSEENYTKIDFGAYDIMLSDPHEFEEVREAPDAMMYTELKEAIGKQKGARRILYVLEFHRRWALAAACLIFALLGVGLSTVTNRRAVRSGGMVICVSAVVFYWILAIGFESLARQEIVAPVFAAWLPNIVFLALAIHQVRRLAKG